MSRPRMVRLHMMLGARDVTTAQQSSNWSQSIRTMGVEATRKEAVMVEDKEGGMLEATPEEDMEKAGTVMVAAVTEKEEGEEITVA